MENFHKVPRLRVIYRSFSTPLLSVGGSLVILLAACLVGCGHRGPKVEFVEGTVLFDNQPVADATVFFLPVDATDARRPGLPAAGRTGSDGSFRLNATQGARAGAGTAVGRYLVTVSKQESPPIPEPDGNGVLPPAPADVIVRDLLPVRYGDRKTTPLQVEVQPGINRFRFELTASAKSPEPQRKKENASR